MIKMTLSLLTLIAFVLAVSLSTQHPSQGLTAAHAQDPPVFEIGCKGPPVFEVSCQFDITAPCPPSLPQLPEDGAQYCPGRPGEDVDFSEHISLCAMCGGIPFVQRIVGITCGDVNNNN